jgi:quinol monooxygenase YgiN
LNYYVYYKVAPERLTEIGSAVKSLLATVESQTGVRGRWMRRRDDPTTYMEVFEGVKDEAAFEALLAREGARFGVQRKVERFISAETPA